MSIDRNRLRAVVERLAEGGTATVPAVIAELHALGAVRNIHLDAPEQLKGDVDKTAEWYAGQLLDILESKAWFAVNSVCNCVDKFCPATT